LRIRYAEALSSNLSRIIMKVKIKDAIFLLLLFLTIFTIYLSISEILGQTVCIAGEHANCDIVQNSKYGKISGIRTTFIGTIAITLLFASFLFSSSKSKYKQNFKEIYILGTIIGSLGALYFISIQIFILKTFCSSCLVVDITIIIISVLSWINYKK
jgi:uncharacterized membrane protein